MKAISLGIKPAKPSDSPKKMRLIWDPEKCAINEDLRIADYLALGEA